MIESFYVREGDRFISTPFTRGPWSEAHQHGGPPSALALRAVEERLASGPAMRVAAMTVELLRPVPIAPLSVTTEINRPGRRAVGVDTLVTAGDELVVRARALAIRIKHEPVPAPPLDPPPRPPVDSSPWHMPFFRWPIGYHVAMELRIARGTFGQGNMACWMRMRVPLVAGEEPSPMQRLACAADSGNGVGLLLDVTQHSFINPEVSFHCERLPAGEWICLDAHTRLASDGMGLVDTRLYDERGAIGMALQSIVVDKL